MRYHCAIARVLLCSVLILALECHADQRYYVLDPDQSGARLRSDIVSPQDFLGFRVGARPVTHQELKSYFQYLAKTSPAADYFQYGETQEGKELFALIISDPDNLARISQINEALDEISGPGQNSAELIRSSPAVAWMDYGTHGDELASSDAALMVAYRLVAGEDDEIETIRRNLVAYVDPMFNPEGRARATQHVETFKRSMASVDPQDILHNQFWTHGRGNHYFFDLNRDAVFQVQMQSRQRVKAILQAHPQLFVAGHELNADDTYLFAVPAEPLNPFLPDQVHASWADFSKDHSAAFDERGISYYTRAWNEVFYPGYYDIWPAYFGAVPILYETAATSGVSVEIPTEQIRSFHTAVANHFRSSMANLVTASRNKDVLLTRWAEVRRKLPSSSAKTRAWLVLPEDSYKSRETLRILTSLGIKVDVLASPLTARNLRSYWDDTGHGLNLPTGTLRVVVDQPLSRLIHNLFDYHVPMSSEFLTAEKRNLDLGHNTQIYDVTAWSLPLAFNASVYWSDSELSGANWQNAPTDNPGGADAVNRQDLTRTKFGYLYKDESLQATARLLAAGLRIRVADKAFVHSGTLYAPGTFLVRSEEQSIDPVPLLTQEANAHQISVVLAQSARITEGGPDLGGRDFTLLQAPRIALLGGTGVSTTSFGAIWYLLDAQLRVPVTLLNVEDLNELDLSRYSVLILPETFEKSSLPASLKSGSLQRWIESGGTLVAMGTSSLLLASSGISSVKARGDVLDKYPPTIVGRSAEELTSNDFRGLLLGESRPLKILPPVIGDAARHFIPHNFQPFAINGHPSTPVESASVSGVPDGDKISLGSNMKKYLPRGAYLRVELKSEHWLTYGVGDKVPALFRDPDVLIAGPDLELVGRYAGPRSLMMSGLVWPEATGYIAGTAYLVRERKGRGQLISFANDPTFRGYSLGTSRIFLNAVILGGAYK